VAVGLSAVLLLSSWITTGAISLSLQHTPSIEKPLDMFDDLYDKPWTRFGPYLVGMAAGWFLSETSGALKMTKVFIYFYEAKSTTDANAFSDRGLRRMDFGDEHQLRTGARALRTPAGHARFGRLRRPVAHPVGGHHRLDSHRLHLWTRRYIQISTLPIHLI
jgi:hypothetical protein